MTDDRSTLPPRWAESVVRTMLRPKDRESISGDLLEEYRQSIVPALGARADRWYIRQVGLYVLRATLPWALFVAAILVGRYLLDTFSPTQYTRGIVHPRSAIMSQTLIATFALGGCWRAWRTAQWSSGLIAAFAIATIGGTLSILATLLCLAVWHDPQTWQAINGSGGIGEALYGVPLILVPVGTFVGAAGAAVGRGAAAIFHPDICAAGWLARSRTAGLGSLLAALRGASHNRRAGRPS